MDILIVEDDQSQLDGIEAILLEYYTTIHCYKAVSYSDAVAILDSHTIQLFLLDIELSKNTQSKDGIALGTYIRQQPQYQKTPILFLTALPKEAPRAIHNTHCYDYLVKPYKEHELLESIDKLTKEHLIEFEPLELRDVNGIYFRIRPKDILYLETNGRGLNVITEDDKIILRYVHLKNFASQLPPYFTQCHKSFIINNNYLKSYAPSDLTVCLTKNNIVLPVGRKYKDNIRRLLSISQS